MKTKLLFTVLTICFSLMGTAQRRQMPPISLDPYFFEIKGIYNHAEIQPGVGASLSYPATPYINILVEGMFFPKISAKHFNEYSYEMNAMFKFYKLKNEDIFSALVGINRSNWRGDLITTNDGAFNTWKTSESFMLGLHYKHPMGRYVNFTASHKVYLNYFVQTTSLGFSFPIYYGPAPKDGRVKRKVPKNQSKNFGKRKMKLKLNKGRGNV